MEVKAGQDHCHWGILWNWFQSLCPALTFHDYFSTLDASASGLLLIHDDIGKKTFLSLRYSTKLTVTRNYWLRSKSWRRGNLRWRGTWRRKETQTVLSGRTWRPWTRNWRTVMGDWAPLTRYTHTAPFVPPPHVSLLTLPSVSCSQTVSTLKDEVRELKQKIQNQDSTICAQTLENQELQEQLDLQRRYRHSLLPPLSCCWI